MTKVQTGRIERDAVHYLSSQNRFIRYLKLRHSVHTQEKIAKMWTMKPKYSRRLLPAGGGGLQATPLGNNEKSNESEEASRIPTNCTDSAQRI